MVERTYVDVNVFVYWLAKHHKYGETAKMWVRKIEEGKRGEFLTSALTLYELAVILAGLTGSTLKNKKIIEIVVDALTNLAGLEIVSLKREDHIATLELMDKYKLDYEDSLHLAVAMRERATKIISNDEDFDRTPLKRIF